MNIFLEKLERKAESWLEILDHQLQMPLVSVIRGKPFMVDPETPMPQSAHSVRQPDAIDRERLGLPVLCQAEAGCLR